MASPKPILIIDDDEEHLDGLGDLLEGEGYSVVEAANGQRALDYLLDPEELEPALVLLDLNMPVMTGWQLLAIMKGYTRLARVPVALITGERLLLDLISHGTVAAVVRKPYDSYGMVALVAKLARPADRPAG